MNVPAQAQPGGAARPHAFALRPAGHLACLAFCLVLPPLASGWRIGAVAGVAFAIAAAAGWRGVSILADWRTWALVAALVVPALFVIGRGEAPAGGDVPAHEGLVVGAQVALRAVSMLLGIGSFAASVSVPGLSALVERAGLRGLGFALGVAVNALPTVAEKAALTYHAIRLRGGFTRRRLSALRIWLIAVVVASLRHADEVVSAAEARAFTAEQPRRLPSLAGWPDGVVSALLAGAAIVILCW